MSEHDAKMQYAIDEALLAFDEGEVPVGAAIFIDDILIASEHNRKEQHGRAIAHAELLAIDKACAIVGDWRLCAAELYVTAEPCFMCAGAALQARIKRVVFGVPELKFGGVITHATLFDIVALNHHVEYMMGVRENEIKLLMQTFFKKIRAER